MQPLLHLAKMNQPSLLSHGMEGSEGEGQEEGPKLETTLPPPWVTPGERESDPWRREEAAAAAHPTTTACRPGAAAA